MTKDSVSIFYLREIFFDSYKGIPYYLLIIKIMKPLIVLSIIALSTCTFLRDLQEVTISSTVYKDCITAATDLVKVELVTGSDYSSDAEIQNLKAVFTKDTSKTITVGTCTVNTTAISCTETSQATISDDTATGNYTLDLKLASGTPTNTYKINGLKSLCYTKAACYSVASATSKTQEITIEDGEKGSFSLTLNEAFTTAPDVQVASKKVTCTGDKDTKKITCTPKKDEVTEGEGQVVTIGECQLPTGVTLKVNSESFNKLSKIAFVVLAFLLF